VKTKVKRGRKKVRKEKMKETKESEGKRMKKNLKQTKRNNTNSPCCYHRSLNYLSNSKY